jgi:hypothetical protein
MHKLNKVISDFSSTIEGKRTQQHWYTFYLLLILHAGHDVNYVGEEKGQIEAEPRFQTVDRPCGFGVRREKGRKSGMILKKMNQGFFSVKCNFPPKGCWWPTQLHLPIEWSMNLGDPYFTTLDPPRLKCDSDFPFFFFHWTLVLFFYAPTQVRLGFALLGWAKKKLFI